MSTESRAKHFIDAAEFRGIDEGSGSLTGYIVKFHELNDHGEIYLPGSSKRTSEQFLTEGFNTDSHDWGNVGGNIGFPTDIHEDENGVLSTFEFHSTPSAQAVRTVAKERMAKGLRIGLSIGFNWDENTTTYIYPRDYQSELPRLFRSDMLAELMAEAKRFNRIRVIRDFTLYEYSVVNAPSQNDANATQIRSAENAREKLEAQVRTYLSDTTGGEVAINLISCIWSMLMYDLLWPCMWDTSTPADELSSKMCGMIDECSQLAQALIPQVLSTCAAILEQGETTDTVMEDMARFVLPPNDFNKGEALGLTLDAHSRLALSAVNSVQSRIAAIAALNREKNPELRKGAEISQKNKERLNAHADSAKSIYEGLCAMTNDMEEEPAMDSTEYIGTNNSTVGATSETNASELKLSIQKRLIKSRLN